MDFSNFPWFVVGMCLLFLATGVWLIVSGVKKKTACTVEVEGEVVDIVRVRDDGRTKYGVVYTYEYNGKPFRKHPDCFSTRYPQVQPGDPYIVKIDPNNPNVCCSSDETGTIVFGAVFVVFSLIIMCIFLFVG